MARKVMKLFKILGLIVVVLLVGLAIYAFWSVRRPWPQVSGEAQVAGLGAPVEVVRDRWGVPHLFAQSAEDLLFAQGYVHAQDRLWQMEFNRTIANGRLSAMVGAFGVDTDRLTRTLGLRRAAKRDWQALGPEARGLLEAYTRGVNAYIDSHRGRLGLEFSVLGIDPEPWQPQDTLAWTKLMSLALSLNLSREIMRWRFDQELGELADDASRRLMPAYPEGEPVIVSDWEAPAGAEPTGEGPGGTGSTYDGSSPPAPGAAGVLRPVGAARSASRTLSPPEGRSANGRLGLSGPSPGGAGFSPGEGGDFRQAGGLREAASTRARHGGRLGAAGSEPPAPWTPPSLGRPRLRRAAADMTRVDGSPQAPSPKPQARSGGGWPQARSVGGTFQDPGPKPQARSGGRADRLRSALESQLGRGSNGWVVAGRRTETGMPILANDTHLGLGMPSVYYEVGLHGGGFDVVGFSFPGLPGVVIGRNGQIAWGITSLATDIMDLYFERVDDPEAPTRYEVDGEWRDLQVAEEVIEVKGGEAETLRVLSTHHGPLINGLYQELAEAPPAALAWTVLEPNSLVEAVLDLDRAGGWEPFRAALSRWRSPALSFLYADRAGNVGYQAVGAHPRRAPGHDGTKAVDGWTREHDWQGFLPFEELPSTLNPEAGFVVSANNKTVGDEYPYDLGHDWADPRRARRITQLLEGDEAVSVEDTRRFQADTRSLLAEDLRPYLLAVEPHGELETQALAAFEQWDLTYQPDRVGASIFHVWNEHLLKDVVADELGDDLYQAFRGFPLLQHSVTAALVAEEDNPWFDDRTTPKVEGRQEMLQRSFSEAVQWLEENHGGDPAAWQWGRLHTITFTHPILGATGIGPVDALANSDTLPAPGGPFTVFAATPSLGRPYAMVAGPAQRLVADLTDPDATLAVNSTGQCAHLFHPHREDLIPLWLAVDYHPLPLSRDRIEVENVLTLVP